MGWPPEIGKPLPRAAEAIGVRRKLIDYSLNSAHQVGEPKARGFETILGITIRDVGHLARAIEVGIHHMAISDVRDSGPCGYLSEVVIPVHRLGRRRESVARLTTAGELIDIHAAPRLVSAYIGS